MTHILDVTDLVLAAICLCWLGGGADCTVSWSSLAAMRRLLSGETCTLSLEIRLDQSN